MLLLLHTYSNPVCTFEAVSFMSLCPTILELDLRDNPVTTLPDYRKIVHEMMPDLKLLDGEAFYDNPAADESLSSSEYSSSSASDQPTNSQPVNAKREFEELTGSGTSSSRVFDPSKLRFNGVKDRCDKKHSSSNYTTRGN